MRSKLCKSIVVISIILMPILLSCATTQQKQKESRDADFYFDQGIAHFTATRYDRAISDFTKAIEADPKHAKAYNDRGLAYWNIGQYDQAIADYTKAIEIDPKLAIAYYNRAVVYYFKKEYDKSWEDVRKAQDLGYHIPSKFLEDLRKASERQNWRRGLTDFQPVMFKSYHV